MASENRYVEAEVEKEQPATTSTAVATTQASHALTKLSRHDLQAKIKYHAEQIGGCWYKSVDAILDTAEKCTTAWLELGDEKHRAQLRKQLPFNKTTFSMFIGIGRQVDALRKLKHQLPASYSALYHISQVDAKLIAPLLNDKTIHPGSTREQIRSSLAQFKKDMKITKVIAENSSEEGEDVSMLCGKHFVEIFYPTPLPSHKVRVAMEKAVKSLCKEYGFPFQPCVWLGKISPHVLDGQDRPPAKGRGTFRQVLAAAKKHEAKPE